MDVDDAERRREPAPARFGMPLSPREVETLQLLSCGHSYDDIAELMEITSYTVKSHLKRVFIKMGARNGVHAVALAYETKVFPFWTAGGPR